MKRLYISDLDGTLFDPKGEITGFTADAINSLIGKGMNFAFATARSIYSAKPMTEKLRINAPCILMNGVSIYSLSDNTYIKNNFFDADTAEQVIEIFERHNVRCFVYKIHGDVLTAYFTEMTSEVMEAFAEERKRKFRKPFVQCERFLPDKDIVYFTTTGKYDTLFRVKNDIDKINCADCTFYEDTYTNEWYLEVFSSDASKYNGVNFLREKYGYDEIVCFGDNLNDIPMFGASDVKIAVENAKPELKRLADFITPSNTENGVAKWLMENFKNV